MFNRFAESARSVVVDAQLHARQLGAEETRALHLFRALIEDDAVMSAALGAQGVDVTALRAQIDGDRVQPGSLRPLSDADAEALAALGIDLAEIRARMEERFGTGALDRPVPQPRARRFGLGSVRRRAGGGHLRFSQEAKAALVATLRETVRLQANRIGTGHLSLGLLDVHDAEVTQKLAAAAVDVAALRAFLEHAERRAA